jgi:hypothetical protein
MCWKIIGYNLPPSVEDATHPSPGCKPWAIDGNRLRGKSNGRMTLAINDNRLLWQSMFMIDYLRLFGDFWYNLSIDKKKENRKKVIV